MAVGVHDQGYSRMTEHVHDHPRMDALGEQEAGRGVSLGEAMRRDGKRSGEPANQCGSIG